MCAVVALVAPARAQCVVDADHVSGLVVVDRGDGEPIHVALDEATATITIPERARDPLTVDVGGTLAMRGTSGREILSLAAGTYGVMTVDQADTVALTAARSVGEGVEVTVELGTGRARAFVMPCRGIGTRRPWATGRRRDPSGPLAGFWYARRGRLAIASEADGPTMIEIEDLVPSDWVDVLEEVERWSHVQLRGVGVTVEGWVPTRALRRWRGPLRSRGSVGRGPGVGCASMEDTEHVVAAPGTPVTIPGTDRVWARLEGDESVLVRITGDQAELLATPRARADMLVGGCVARVVLGIVDARYLTRGVVSVFGLRMRLAGDGVLLESRPDDDAALRDDLHAGDLIVAVNGSPLEAIFGSPLEARHVVHRVAHSLAVVGLTYALTVMRGGEAVELPARERLYRGSRPWVAPSAIERALAD